MTPQNVIENLSSNAYVFKNYLKNLQKEEFLFRPNPTHWCLLEITCHLRDEEKEDFRARIFHLKEHPETSPPPFNPLDWVVERKYMKQDYHEVLQSFLSERKKSIEMLETLHEKDWLKAYNHAKLGRLTAFHFLSNWLAHDYLHLRQITKVKYEYLKSSHSQIDFKYAGNWLL